MNELFKDMQNKGLISFEKSSGIKKALENLTVGNNLNRQISLELAQTIPFIVKPEQTDNYKPTYFDVIPETYKFKNEIADRRN
jgi:hypothetical protein